ncbi:hypothetical protein ABT121_42120 [Streptomyces sp. NPDC001928]|uniref:hypothetical protein n=1 Tax=Streptomyces sp. NPDC001928 TaxID=3154404 RepID=UPI00332139F2
MIEIILVFAALVVAAWWIRRRIRMLRVRRAEAFRQKALNPPRRARKATVWVLHRVFAHRFLWRPLVGSVRMTDPAPVARRGLVRTVRIRIDRHLLIAGLTGSGKSSTARVLAAHVLAAGGQLELWDLKPGGPEAAVWGGSARCETSPAGIVARIRDLLADPARDGSHLVIVIDETSSLVRQLTAKQFDELCSLVDIARIYNIHCWFGCQHPSRENLPSAIQANVGAVISHRVRSKVESGVVFNDPAWAPHELRGPGAVLVQEGDSEPVRLRALWLSPERFKALPGGPQIPSSTPVTDPVPLIKVPPPVEAAPVELTDNQELVCLALELADRPLPAKAVTEATGLPQNRVSDALRSLVARSVVTKDPDAYPNLYELAPANKELDR